MRSDWYRYGVLFYPSLFPPLFYLSSLSSRIHIQVLILSYFRRRLLFEVLYTAYVHLRNLRSCLPIVCTCNTSMMCLPKLQRTKGLSHLCLNENKGNYHQCWVTSWHIEEQFSRPYDKRLGARLLTWWFFLISSSQNRWLAQLEFTGNSVPENGIYASFTKFQVPFPLVFG